MFSDESFIRIDVDSKFDLNGKKSEPITTYAPRTVVAEHNGQHFILAEVFDINDDEAPYVRILVPGEVDPNLPAVPFEWLIEQKLKDPFTSTISPR